MRALHPPQADDTGGGGGITHRETSTQAGTSAAPASAAIAIDAALHALSTHAPNTTSPSELPLATRAMQKLVGSHVDPGPQLAQASAEVQGIIGPQCDGHEECELLIGTAPREQTGTS